MVNQPNSTCHLREMRLPMKQKLDQEAATGVIL